MTSMSKVVDTFHNIHQYLMLNIIDYRFIDSLCLVYHKPVVAVTVIKGT